MTEIKEPKFTFENESDEAMGIETAIYSNGHKVKRAKLSDGRLAVIRTLFGRDNAEIAKRSNGNSDNFANAQLSVSTTIDGSPIVPEDIDNMMLKDVNKIIVANSSLNF